MTFQDLIDKYPNLYPKDFYFECLDGWIPLLTSLTEELDVLTDRAHIRVMQVKEKFGTLRFYISCEGDKKVCDIARHLVTYYETKSEHTCEACGNEQSKVREHKKWFVNRCDSCYEQI